MTEPSYNVRVVRGTWFDKQGRKHPIIRIRGGHVSLAIPMNKARHIVDQVHDAVDEYEREQRSNT